MGCCLGILVFAFCLQFWANFGKTLLLVQIFICRPWSLQHKKPFICSSGAAERHCLSTSAHRAEILQTHGLLLQLSMHTNLQLKEIICKDLELYLEAKRQRISKRNKKNTQHKLSILKATLFSIKDYKLKCHTIHYHQNEQHSLDILYWHTVTRERIRGLFYLD